MSLMESRFDKRCKAAEIGSVKAVNKYLSEIGARGGRKRKDHPNKHELAKRAANARWTAKRLSIECATRLASNPNESHS